MEDELYFSQKIMLSDTAEVILLLLKIKEINLTPPPKQQNNQNPDDKY